MNFFVLFLCLGIAVNTFLNYFFLRRPNSVAESCAKSVAVLLPVRNEEENIVDLIISLKTQTDIEDISFCIIDDNSTDKTFSLAQEHISGDPRFLLLRGDPLPIEWLGKPFALQQGFSASSSEIIIVLDADVRIECDAFSRAVSLLERLNLDFISTYPRQIAISWGERLVQPLLQWSWLATVPLKIAERSTNSAFAVANGQFFLAKRSALLEINGFESVKNQVLDDINLARALLRSGLRGTVADGSAISTCRMYKSWHEIENGYGKSLRMAFKSPIGFILTILFLLATGIAPLVFALSGSLGGQIAFALILFSRAISAHASRGRILDSVLHPLSTTLLIYLIFFSWVKRGQIQWKGRPV